MAAQLPYLPPLERYKNDVASIATGTVDDVRAAQGGAAKAALATRGVLATGAAAVRGVNDTLGLPAAIAREQAATFLKNLFGGPQPAQPAPTLGLPQLAKPVAPAAAPAPAVAGPATQAPVATPAGGLKASREGNTVTVTGDAPAVPPVMQALPVYRSNPIAAGISQQAAYAEAQRQAVLDAAAVAAANGHPDNASYRYAAALHALPTLSGQNNFANVQGQAASEAAATAERERSNIRTNAETRYSTDERSKEVRRNAQPTVIGEEVNPDPTTRIFAPTIKKYGFVTRDDKTGKITVHDMQGNEQKPAAPPVARSEFITKNKKANPGMSEADIGREYDRKYGGKG